MQGELIFYCLGVIITKKLSMCEFKHLCTVKHRLILLFQKHQKSQWCYFACHAYLTAQHVWINLSFCSCRETNFNKVYYWQCNHQLTLYLNIECLSKYNWGPTPYAQPNSPQLSNYWRSQCRMPLVSLFLRQNIKFTIIINQAPTVTLTQRRATRSSFWFCKFYVSSLYFL